MLLLGLADGILMEKSKRLDVTKWNIYSPLQRVKIQVGTGAAGTGAAMEMRYPSSSSKR